MARKVLIMELRVGISIILMFLSPTKDYEVVAFTATRFRISTVRSIQRN